MLYDGYAQYHDPNLTPQEQAQLQAAIPDAVVQAHMEIAMARADAQFQGHFVLPEDETMTMRFPGLDPVGKYCVIDMKFAQREAHLKANAAVHGQGNQDYLTYFRDQVSKTPQAREMEQELHQICETHRRLTRAAKLCLDADGAAALHDQARSLEASPCVAQYSQMLSGFEALAGAHPGQEKVLETKTFFQKTFGLSLYEPRVNQVAETWVPPEKLNIPFEDYNARLLQKAFSNPHNWGKSPQDLANDYTPSEDMMAGDIPPYVKESVGRQLTPLFQHHAGTVPFEQLLIVDGMSVAERMAKDGLDVNDQRLVRDTATHYVAEALMTGRRVEAFSLDSQRHLTSEPIAITKSGYSPNPLEPEKLNAWQRFFNRHGGHFAAKAAKEQAYQQTMAARERVRDLVGAAALAPAQDPATHHFQDQLRSKTKAALPRIHAIEQTLDKATSQSMAMGTQFFPQGTPPKQPEGSVFRTQRTAETSFCMGMLAAKGHSLEDIVNPQALGSEKLAMGAYYTQLVAGNQSVQYTQALHQGLTALNNQLSQALPQVGVQSEQSYLKALPDLQCIANASFDLGQELNKATAMLGAQAPTADVVPEVDRGLRLCAPLAAIASSYQAETRLSAGRYSNETALATDLGLAVLGGQLRTTWQNAMTTTGKADGLDHNAVSAGAMVGQLDPHVQALSQQLLKNPDAMDATRLCILQGRSETALNVHMDFTKDANTFLATAKITAKAAPAKELSPKEPAKEPTKRQPQGPRHGR